MRYWMKWKIYHQSPVEWTGGGIYSTSMDLAIWVNVCMKVRRSTTVLLPTLPRRSPGKIRPRHEIRTRGNYQRITTVGTYYGHSGYFPGFLAEVYYFPKYKLAIALQTNSSDFKSLKFNDLKSSWEIASWSPHTQKVTNHAVSRARLFNIHKMSTGWYARPNDYFRT